MKKDTVGLIARMLLVFVAILAGMMLAQHFDAHDAARAGIPAPVRAHTYARGQT